MRGPVDVLGGGLRPIPDFRDRRLPSKPLVVACDTGIVSVAAAHAVGRAGRVLRVDIADGMVRAARERALGIGLGQARFESMDAEQLALADASFDLVLCSLGLMYVPDPTTALREMPRVLRPGGHAVLAVWGKR